MNQLVGCQLRFLFLSHNRRITPSANGIEASIRIGPMRESGIGRAGHWITFLIYDKVGIRRERSMRYFSNSVRYRTYKSFILAH
jgi:hypothetical protein